MEEYTIKQGEAISGSERYIPEKEAQGFEQQRGRNKNYVPTTAFCPQCSTLEEWDSKWGEPKPKWTLQYSDFCFDLEYAEDEEGVFVRCRNCGHDLRQEVKEMHGEKTTKAKKSKSSVDFHQEWLKNVKPHNGYYTMSIQEFKRMAVIGYSSNLKNESLC